MEGMALGKPVMSNLADDHYYLVHRLYTGLDECPIVSTTIEEIKENLRILITQPALRKELGEAGRQYVIKYHSYAAVARMWDLIYRKIWFGESIDLTIWHPDRFSGMDEKRA
jgi:glycosyltransferase involved in cell wall biosynthesis